MVVTAVRGRFLASPRLGTGVVVVCVASLIATGGGYLLERSGEAAPTASTQPVAKAPNPNGSPSPRLPAVSLPKPPKPGQRLPAVGNRTGKPVPPPLPPAPPVQPGSGPRSFTGSSAVALTFDDGPHPTYTPQILDLLRSYGIRATFCVVGTQVRQHPALVARMVREGHSLCNHSWHHDTSLGSRTAAEIRSDLTRTNAEIQRAAPGARIRYFRQPGGRWTPLVIQVAADLGMISIDWDIDPRDWDRPPAQQIADYVIRYTRRGSIVLMHDGGGDRSTTVAACRMILPNLKSRFTLIALR
ncbi:MAG TPA: polysaccharide deacetylase family protein [Micromonosporaceae bacterium]|nr:polysaccharide deacetylase family protein [Micromonosporaceae bacterium]